ncbi:MAG TPA: hypothetical protein VGI39_46030 [Polyangiaceae bacterium]|jgi:hypothetical protein
MRSRTAVALFALAITSLSCSGIRGRSPAFGSARLSSATEDVKPCRGDPPKLPCHHVDLGK